MYMLKEECAHSRSELSAARPTEAWVRVRVRVRATNPHPHPLPNP